jgi:apolipoprotein D and lipocalin family protein
VISLSTSIKIYAASPDIPPLRTVERVDLSRYLGRWYEIARLPNIFQKGCVGSIADYALRDDGEINVINSCRTKDANSLRQVKGRAWSVDPAGNARLKVSFFWPFRSDYWVIELGKEYEYAVVGTPDRKYLWVLSRTATMNDDLYTAILQRAEQQGFDPKAVVRDTSNLRKPGAS